MKALVLFVSVMLSITPLCYAQAGNAGLMNAQKPAAKTIYDYRQELKLSDNQIANIKSLIADLQKTFIDKTKELKELRQTLRTMVQNKEDMRSIRQQLRKIADLQVENSYLEIETSRRVEAVLSADQLSKWKEIRKKAMEEMLAARAAANKK